MTRAALYARVSTDLQEKEGTIQSQTEALRRCAQEKGYVIVAEYVDEGFSGAKLERPGFDRLRDALGSGEFDLVLFHSPDRLARKAVYQGIVLEEMEKAGVKPEFLNYPVDNSPESKMLLGMQGLFAEYERAKIMERTRRGKLHRAREGALVGGHASYGYRWIKKSENGRARLEIDEYQAAVVRRMYTLLLEDRLSTWAIAQRLTHEGVPTAKGAVQWQPMAVFRMVTNPVYNGFYRYRHSEHEEISIPVPPIVDDPTWQAAQDQLAENSLHSRRNNKRHQYLLRGLIRCPRCGGAYTGYYNNTARGYRGYRCQNRDPSISSTGKRCKPGFVSAGPLEDAVWEAVTEALRQPEVLAEEYRRRAEAAVDLEKVDVERKQLAVALKRVKTQEDRVTDAYIHEVMDLERYDDEIRKLADRREHLEECARELDRRQQQQQDSRSALADLDRFCHQVTKGLDALTFEQRQQLLRLVVERATVENGRVRIETVIPTGQGKLCNRRPELVEGPRLGRERSRKPPSPPRACGNNWGRPPGHRGVTAINPRGPGADHMGTVQGM